MGVINSIKNLFSSERVIQLDNLSKESGNVFDYLARATGGNYSTNKFARDIYTRQRLDTHEEKKRCEEAYRENSFIQKGVNTLKNIILGDNPTLKTNAVQIKEFFEDTYYESSGLRDALDIAVQKAITSGDGFIEEVGEGKNIKYCPIFNSEDVYIDYDYQEDKVKRYILKLHQLDKKIEGAETFTLRTPYGIETVYGFELDKDRIIHLRYGISPYGVYGRSSLASALNDIEILDVVERSMAVMSKYKAIPRMLLYNDDQENPLQAEDITNIVETLKTSSDFENPILNKKLESLDLSSGGKEINLQPFIDYLKRKITIILVPEFIIHGENVNRSTSKEQRQEFYLEISAIRKNFQGVLTKALRKSLRPYLEYFTIADSSFTFEFGEYDIEFPEDKVINITNLWEKGILTLKEVREELGYEQIEGVDIFKWETGSNEPSLFTGENITNEKTTRKPNNKKE